MENKTKKNKTNKKGELDASKELARLLYLNGETQKAVAGRVGVSAVTVNRWVREGQWDSLRAAKTISRRELVAKMLTQINDRLEAGDWSADEMVKSTSAIEKLDKQTNVVTVLEVFAAFDRWLINRMQIDPELSPETVKVINRYQDIFISENLSGTTVEIH